MKGKIIKLLLNIFLSINIFNSYAQEKYDAVTPQTADFKKYENIPVSLFTGAINLDIPLYTIKDPDFELPISIGYNSEGFKPLKNSGFVGFNWFLSAGGCITRQVMGTPDDNKSVDGNTSGFLITTRERNQNKDSLFNLQASWPAGEYECMPDIFNFNFLNNSGYFIIGNDGKPKLISDKYYKIDLTGIKGRPTYRHEYGVIIPNDSSEIKVITTDGYIYCFGYSLNALELSVRPSDSPDVGLDQPTPSINAWHLSKIIAPNGRKMLFEYDEGNAASNNSNNALWMYSSYLDRNDTQNTLISIKSATKSVILKKISIPDINFSVSFIKSKESKALYRSIGSPFCNLNYQLDSIIVKNGDKTINKIGLKYTYYNNPNSWGRRFLSEVNLNNTDKYNFTYKKPQLTFDINPRNLVANNNNLDQDMNLTNDLAKSLYGLIDTITYPTRGKTVFEFENHVYNKQLSYKYSNYDSIYQVVVQKVADKEFPGSRIKKIKKISEIGAVENIREYHYTIDSRLETSIQDLQGNDVELNMAAINRVQRFDTINVNPDSIKVFTDSIPNKQYTQECSGIRFTNDHWYSTITGSNPIMTLNSIHYPSRTAFSEPTIGYKSVTEIQYPENGKGTYVVYKFSDVPNNSLNDKKNYRYKIYGSSNESIIMFNLAPTAYNSFSYNYGRLLSTGFINTDFKCNKYEEYSYNGIDYDYYDGNRVLSTTIIPSSMKKINKDSIIVQVAYKSTQNRNSLMSIKLFIAPYFITKKITKEKNKDGNVITNSINYYYDCNNRLVEEKQSVFQKDIFKEYRFADNVITNLSITSSNHFIKGYQALINKFMVGIPVEIVTGCIYHPEESNEQKIYTNAYLTLYKDQNSLPVPQSKYTLEIEKPLLSYNYTSIVTGNLIWDSHLKISKEYEYNEFGRLTKITPVGQLPISYIWGYNNLYPIYEIQGAMTTTYTYKPLVGMTSKTDPRGITTYYEYDPFNRLKCIKDNKGKILQQFDYNYQH